MRYKFPEPPWTYSPKEVNEWINAVYGGHKCKRTRIERKGKWLENVEIDLDLNVEKEIKKPSNLIVKIIEKISGNVKIEENFEILPTVEILLIALSKAGYKKAYANINGFRIEKKKLKKFIEDITKNYGRRMKEIGIYAENDGNANIKIRKIHPMRRHSIEIRINRIKEEHLQNFLIYIRKRLSSEEKIKLK